MRMGRDSVLASCLWGCRLWLQLRQQGGCRVWQKSGMWGNKWGGGGSASREMKNRKLFCVLDCLHSGSNHASDRFRSVRGLTIIKAAEQQVQLQVAMQPCAWSARLPRLIKTYDTFSSTTLRSSHSEFVFQMNNSGYIFLDTAEKNARIRLHQRREARTADFRPPRSSLSLFAKIQHDYSLINLSGAVYFSWKVVCVLFSLFYLKLKSYWIKLQISFFVWSNCWWTTFYFQFISNDLKCTDRWKGDSMTFNNFLKKKKAFHLGKARALVDAHFILQTNRSVLHPSDVFCMQSNSASMTVIWSGRFHW